MDLQFQFLCARCDFGKGENKGKKGKKGPYQGKVNHSAKQHQVPPKAKPRCLLVESYDGQSGIPVASLTK